MAAEVFVDTSAWYPLAVRRHPDHARLAEALTTRVRNGVRIVTTNLVLAESHALLLLRASRPAALEFLRHVRNPPNDIVMSTAELEERAQARWLEAYRDQPFTLADAVSFQVMHERRIREALTLDHHFATAGFVAVSS